MKINHSGQSVDIDALSQRLYASVAFSFGRRSAKLSTWDASTYRTHEEQHSKMLRCLGTILQCPRSDDIVRFRLEA